MSLWIRPTLLTLELMAFTVMMAGTLGMIAAWASSVLSRGNTFQRLLNQLFLTIHLLIASFPLILQAVAWESTAGKFGLTMLTQTGVRGVAGSPYGFFGGLIATGWIHGITGASIVYLATYFGARRIPIALIETARLQFNENQLWWKIRLPLAKPWWITSLLAVAMLAATEMTVADLYGYRTLADEFYLLYAANPSTSSIIQTCVLPLILMVGGSLWWTITQQRSLALKHHQEKDFGVYDEYNSVQSSPPFSLFSTLTALCVLSLLTLIVSFTPLFSTLLKLGQQIQIQGKTFSANWSAQLLVERLLEAPIVFRDEYFWTVVLSSFTSSLAIIFAWPMAAKGRTAIGIQRSFDFATLGIAIIPGPIIAMTVIHFFQLPVPGFQDLYERSIIPTSIALLARAVPIAYWLIRAGYSAIPDRQLDSLRLEMHWLRRLITVDRYYVGRSLLQAWLIAALFASGDLPASLPVLPPGMTTVGSRLFGLLHSGARFQEAALAFWYLFGFAISALILLRIRATAPKMQKNGVN